MRLDYLVLKMIFHNPPFPATEAKQDDARLPRGRVRVLRARACDLNASAARRLSNARAVRPELPEGIAARYRLCGSLSECIAEVRPFKKNLQFFCRKKIFFYFCVVNPLKLFIMKKFSSLALQYGCYSGWINQIRSSLHGFRISQADFAAYLHIAPKALSHILSCKVVPNAALFSYMIYVLNNYSALCVFMRWLERNGSSSLSNYRSRRLRFVELPLPF